ncbi:MAG TPA: LysR family transcriptional regulator [Burkholderiaceae bacterium]|nr:LysR family transcriptional regulator [Burkholderiaceae bacterium]
MKDIELRRYDLNLLPVLDLLLRTRSTTETANILARTQPGISRDLAKLRSIFGDPLLIRVKGRLEPTTYALSLWPSLKQALEATRVTLERAAPFNPASSNDVFQIGSNSFTESLLSSWMAAELPKIAPNISIRFAPVPAGAAVPAEALQNGQMHLVVGRFNSCPEGCAMQELFTDRRVCVLRKGHPLEGKKLTLDMMKELRFVTTSTMLGRPNELDSFLAEKGITRRFQFFLSNLALAPYVLLRSDCVTTLPLRAAKLALEQYPLALAELPAGLGEASYSMIWAKRWAELGALKWLRQQVEQACESAGSY